MFYALLEIGLWVWCWLLFCVLLCLLFFNLVGVFDFLGGFELLVSWLFFIGCYGFVFVWVLNSMVLFFITVVWLGFVGWVCW